MSFLNQFTKRPQRHEIKQENNQIQSNKNICKSVPAMKHTVTHRTTIQAHKEMAQPYTHANRDPWNEKCPCTRHMQLPTYTL